MKMFDTEAIRPQHDNLFLYTYLDHLQVTGKPASFMRAKFAIKNLHGPVADGRSVDQYITLRRLEGAKNSTINAELRILRAALNFVGDERGAEVVLLREERRIRAILSEVEVEKLLTAAGTGPTRLACLLGLYGGLRHQEIMHLRWRDVMFFNRTLVVAAWGGWSPKNHAERVIPLHERLSNELQWAKAKASTHTQHNDALVVQAQDLYPLVRRVFEQCGFRNGDREGLHMLRRTFASRALEKGADINTVRELMGHADLATTQKYLVSSDNQKRRAVAAL